MIKGIGIDSVEIERFIDWVSHSKEKLKKIFSDKEIMYCLDNKGKAAERFAARFAVKEAFYKALSQILPNNGIPLLTACKAVSVKQEENGNPTLSIDWEKIPQCRSFKNAYQSLVSITHTKNTATAIVMLEKIS